jgi:hypothetical protein
MSEDIGFPIESAVPWFHHINEAPYVFIQVSKEQAESWAGSLGAVVRRCYVSDAVVNEKALEHRMEKNEIIAAKLPDSGAIMAGDFGEILVYLYQACKALPEKAIGPKKWRLKQDRTKTAPYSDVVHFVLPDWPLAGNNDQLLCSEVKVKSTSGISSPIKDAIKDSGKDRTSRLAKTLLWLRERAIFESLDDIQIAHLNRFIKATEHPAFERKFRAVAIICSTLLSAELAEIPTASSVDYTLVVIEVPDLKNIYTSVFEAAKIPAAIETRQLEGEL